MLELIIIILSGAIFIMVLIIIALVKTQAKKEKLDYKLHKFRSEV